MFLSLLIHAKCTAMCVKPAANCDEKRCDLVDGICPRIRSREIL